MRHVAVMTVTGAIGLIAIFIVDFLSLFYISLLRDDRLTAGVGYATSVLLLAVSISIGLMIAGSALLARGIGARDLEAARRIASTALILSALVGMAVSVVLLSSLSWLLPLLGASGVPLEVATRFLWITLPVNALMALGMSLSGFLRAVGDPRRAMNVTLFGGLVTAFTDPLLIFGLELGTDGAAWATVISRIIFALVGFYGLLRVHHLLRWPGWREVVADARPFFGIALPAILTNVATPVAALFIYRVLAPFGEAAIAASAILDRVTPVAYGVLFALSGAVGPILAQNLGARRFDRLRLVMRDAMVFAMLYCLFAWILLYLLRHQIAALFGVSGQTAAYVAFFCAISGATWCFLGLLFVANAAFNNLGFPLYSTAFNWGRATIGTMPFAWVGAQQWGVEGSMIGILLGSGVFGLLACWTAFRALGLIEDQGAGRP